jgi:hypothetical protein
MNGVKGAHILVAIETCCQFQFRWPSMNLQSKPMSDSGDLRRLTFSLISLIATPIALYYAASWLFETLDPLKSRNDAAKKQSAKAIQRLQKSVKDADVRLKDINEHETVIMSEVITPEELNVKFDGTDGTWCFR